jgi:hypothetical protein
MAATANLGITLPDVGGSTDTWGATLNTGTTAIDALFSVSGTDVTMSDIKFNSISVQETGAGTDTVKIQAPSAVTTSYTLTMPAAVGSTNQVLSAADGSGTLAWTTPVTGDITAIVAGAGLTGTSLSGPIPTLNVIGTADKVTVSADAVTIASTYVGQTSITTLGTIATGTWEGTTVAVDQGGTGATSLTDGGVLLGSGTGAITATAVLGDGVILIGDASGDPATLDVGSSTAITILGTVATGVWNGTAIANANLANSTVSYGGVSLALGASDANPAFDLSDATAYTGDSSLVTVGTVASGTWNGTAVGVAYGGTAISSYAAGDILYASGSTTLAKLAKGSDTEVLTLASGVPTWAAPTVGDITGVTAGTGLSGGGTTGTVTLNVNASQTQITSVGALGAGSISSGFGAIDVGSSSIDGGTITGTFAGNITGNVTGNASGTAATVTGAAQTAITSVGTLTSLGVGDVTSSGDISLVDSKSLELGTGTDATLLYDGTNAVFTPNAVGSGALIVSKAAGSLPGSVDAATSLIVQRNSATGNDVILDLLSGDAGDSKLFFSDDDYQGAGAIVYDHTTPHMAFGVGENTEFMRCDAATGRNVGIGLTDAEQQLQVKDATYGFQIEATAATKNPAIVYETTDGIRWVNGVNIAEGGTDAFEFRAAGSVFALRLAYDGGVVMPNLPTSDPSVAGELWNDSGTVKISS